MIKLRRLKLAITASKDGEAYNPKAFGFDIPFSDGLNIIAGENTSGKSTILSCIYYALGFEQLIGGRRNEYALDKALRENFYINVGGVRENYNVIVSTVYLEIANSRNESVTIVRDIKSGQRNDSGSNLRTGVVTVFTSEIKNDFFNTSYFKLFLNSRHDHEGETSFYEWLAAFIGFRIPYVYNESSASNNESPLYLQTIFPAFFIEQTKGWSEFLATSPFFGIRNNKEKTIEFILALKQLNISNEEERIRSEVKKLNELWSLISNKLEVLSAEYEGVITHNTGLTADEKAVNIISIQVKDDVTLSGSDHHRPIHEMLIQYEAELTEYQNRPLRKVAENKNQVRSNVVLLKEQYFGLKKQFEDFELELNKQKYQLDSLNKQLLDTNREIVSTENINKVFDESLVRNYIHSCPTCHQEVEDLLGVDNVNVSQLNLEESLKYLKNLRKVIEDSSNSLRTIIEEKEIIKKYFQRKLQDLEEEIKISLSELIADDRDYSDSDALKRVRLEKRIADLKILQERFNFYKQELYDLADKYAQLLVEKESLDKDLADDQKKLNEFQTSFRKFLNLFGYRSNDIWSVFIQDRSPFKYFPVIKSGADSFPQKIKINSSASDFIRSIWAYTLSLLVNGVNHSGVIILDEPGQHSMNSVSLKRLFEISSKIKGGQIIIGSSIEGDQTKGSWSLQNILQGLKIGTDYSIYEIGGDKMAIGEV